MISRNTFSLSENQFSRKTYSYTIRPRKAAALCESSPSGGLTSPSAGSISSIRESCKAEDGFREYRMI